METSEAAIPVAYNVLFVFCLAYLAAQCNLEEAHPLSNVFLGSQKRLLQRTEAAAGHRGVCVLRGVGDGGGGMQEVVLKLKGCRSRQTPEL